MNKKILPLLVGLLLVFFAFISFSEARGDTSVGRKEVFLLLKDGIVAQKKVVTEKLTKDDAYKVLSPYLSNQFFQAFADDNINESGSKSYSKDNLENYTPNFSFSKDTKVVYDTQHEIIYVYELLKNQYITLMIVKEKGNWKIGGYYANPQLLPEVEKLKSDGKFLN